MGRQVNFFLSQDDQAVLNDLIMQPGDVIVLATKPDRDPVKVLASTVIRKMGAEYIRVALTKHAFAENLTYHPLGDGRAYLDLLDSSAIEYARCYVSPPGQGEPGFIRSGRLYYTTTRNDMSPKEADFVNWAERLFRKIKKHLVLEDGLYAGEDALRKRKQGWQLRQF